MEPPGREGGSLAQYWSPRLAFTATTRKGVIRNQGCVLASLCPHQRSSLLTLWLSPVLKDIHRKNGTPATTQNRPKAPPGGWRRFCLQLSSVWPVLGLVNEQPMVPPTSPSPPQGAWLRPTRSAHAFWSRWHRVASLVDAPLSPRKTLSAEQLPEEWNGGAASPESPLQLKQPGSAARQPPSPRLKSVEVHFSRLINPGEESYRGGKECSLNPFFMIT